MGTEDGIADERITALEQRLGEEGLWVATAGGLMVLNGALDLESVDLPALAGRGLTGLATDVEGKLWILGRTALGVLQKGSFTLLEDKLELPDDRAPRYAVADGQGGLYFANEQAVRYFHPELGIESLGRLNGLPGDGACSLFIDREGILWIGTERGLLKIIGRNLGRYTRRQGLFDDDVMAVLERASGDMVLAHRGGLTFLEGGKVRTLVLERSNLEEVQPLLDLAEDDSDQLWVAARSAGLVRIDPGGGTRYFGAGVGLEGPVTAVHHVEGVGLWVGTEQGLYRQEGERFESYLGMPEVSVRRIVEDGTGRLLLATSAGLYRVDYPERSQGPAVVSGPSGEQAIRAWSAIEGGGDSLFAVLETGDGELWAGTAAGLFRTRGEVLVREENPRVDRPVFFLLRGEDGELWIGTDDGVLRWNGERLFQLTVQNGLAGRETFRAGGVLDSRGDVWIGTEHGVSVWSARRPTPKRQPPILELLSVEVSGRLEPVDRPLDLEAGDNDVAFHYRLVTFAEEERTPIRVQLEGFEEAREEIADRSREVRYPNLPPGTYRFLLSAGIGNEGWLVRRESASIVIPQPLWQRPSPYIVPGPAPRAAAFRWPTLAGPATLLPPARGRGGRAFGATPCLGGVVSAHLRAQPCRHAGARWGRAHHHRRQCFRLSLLRLQPGRDAPAQARRFAGGG